MDQHQVSHPVEAKLADVTDGEQPAKSTDLMVAGGIAVPGAVAAFVAIRAVTPEFFPLTTQVLRASVRGIIERTRLLQDAAQVYEALRFGVGCGLLWLVMRGGVAGRSRPYMIAVVCVLAMLLPGPPLTIAEELLRPNESMVFALSLLTSTLFFGAVVGLAAVLATKARSSTLG